MTTQNDWEVIHSYSRKQALSDGVLVDVTATAKEAGFRVPVALTQAVWAECVVVPEGIEYQDEAGRLWDVLWMCGLYSRQQRVGPEIRFRLGLMRGPDDFTVMTLKAVCGPDDDGLPCVTVMFPHED